MAAPSLSVGLPCPSCGGAITVEEAQRSAACPYCSSLLWVEGDAGVRRIMFKNQLARDHVAAAARKWFDKGLKARDLDKSAQVTEVYPIYVPFWRVNCRAAGWVCGYREETRTDAQGRTHKERVYLEKMVLRDYDWSNIACDAGDLGLKQLRSLQGPLTAQEEGIPTFDVTTSPTEAAKTAVDWVAGRARADAGVPHVTFEKVHVIPTGQTLLFEPVWIVRYTYRGRSYFATFDGVSGDSLSGRAPGDPLAQSLVMAAGSAIGGLVAALGFLAGASGWSDSPAAIAIAGLGAGAALWYVAYRFFRHGSEIVEGDIEAAYMVKLKVGKGRPAAVQGQDAAAAVASQVLRMAAAGGRRRGRF